MARSDYQERESARLQEQRASVESNLAFAESLQDALGALADSVAQRNLEIQLEQERAHAAAELDRIEADERRLELVDQEREAKDAAQEKETQLKEAREDEDRQKAEAFEKEEREKKDYFEDEDRKKTELLEQEEQRKEALAEEELRKIELAAEEIARGEEVNEPDREENAISDAADALAYDVVKAADVLLEIKQAIELELEKARLEKEHEKQREELEKEQARQREELEKSLRARQWDEARIQDMLDKQAEVHRQQQEALRLEQERQRQIELDRQAREAAERAARASMQGLSL
jgi:hypothetical protein